jgi:hypothetical protein
MSRVETTQDVSVTCGKRAFTSKDPREVEAVSDSAIDLSPAALCAVVKAHTGNRNSSGFQASFHFLNCLKTAGTGGHSTALLTLARSVPFSGVTAWRETGGHAGYQFDCSPDHHIYNPNQSTKRETRQ